MKTSINKYEFIDAFTAHNRMSNFEYDGLAALFNYLEELEESTGEEIELDVIALCCDYTRFESVQDYNEQYGANYDDRYDIEAIACTIDDGAFICYAH